MRDDAVQRVEPEQRCGCDPHDVARSRQGARDRGDHQRSAERPQQEPRRGARVDLRGRRCEREPSDRHRERDAREDRRAGGRAQGHRKERDRHGDNGIASRGGGESALRIRVRRAQLGPPSEARYRARVKLEAKLVCRPSISWMLVALSLARCAASTTPSDSGLEAATDAATADTHALDARSDSGATMETSVVADASEDRVEARDSRVEDARAEGGDASGAADVTTDAASPSGPSCDRRRVTCERVAPVCASGEAPSVLGTCWGPCVAATSCVCASNDECPDVRGFSEICYPRQMRCGPLL
jgi:hypothetical protein